LGASLGLTFTPEVAGTLTDMAGISVIFSVLIVLNGIILGFAIHKLFKIDLITSLLACAAAGVSQMSAIALDMDADAVVVSVIQSIRLVAIVLILPPVIIYIM
jgi:membrane AbrB-like protein